MPLSPKARYNFFFFGFLPKHSTYILALGPKVDNWKNTTPDITQPQGGYHKYPKNRSINGI